ncbi:MAG: EAL domain-containing protein, partial [Granulosicoccus sp.]|nr:EAL domain-containing protein [Granulosicoccus sp.]
MPSNDKDFSITTVISSLAQNLNLGLMAEGVENNQQVEFLRQKGCDELQGFLFSKLVCAAELESTLLST